MVVDIECDALSDPDNGDVSFRIGVGGFAIVIYTCDEGYLLIGSPIRKCLFGEWTESPPTCEGIPNHSIEF